MGAARRFSFLVAAVSLVSAAQVMAIVPAAVEEPVQVVDPVENAPFQFIGQVHAENVFLRSGPGENHYATMRLNKGAELTVMGMKFDWLKVLPPEGSYSLIAKQFVQRADGAKTGIVTAANVRVRAAGNASNLKTMVQCQLSQGDEVTILGEEDSYYQIKPPADAYLFVNEKFVTPLRQINVAPIAKQDRQTGNIVPPIGGTFANPTTQPVKEDDAGAVPQKPTTQPVKWDMAKMETEFDRLEDLVRASATKRIDEQPINELIIGYQGLAKHENLPMTMRQITQVRLLTLRAKAKSQEEYLATRKVQDETEKKLAALRAERDAVEQRMIGNVTVYTAVGTLQASTLQSGSGTLYRLTDPSTGRTMCYVRGTKDPKFVTFVNQFVGVKGELSTEPQLSMKVIPATEIVAVDPQKVNKTVVAQVIPPSLVGKTPVEKK
jgi:uncharacterized protein YgiM (DUF1202 family)